MSILILGLVLFLGVHSIRIVAEDWRAAQLRQWGPMRWRAAYTAVSVAGLGLVMAGYGAARAAPVDLWMPPTATRHVAALLMLLSFVLLTAAYVPGSRLKAKVRHPMLLGVKVWALAHLLANGRLADVVLFGSFLLWAVLGVPGCAPAGSGGGRSTAAAALRTRRDHRVRRHLCVDHLCAVAARAADRRAALRLRRTPRVSGAGTWRS